MDFDEMRAQLLEIHVVIARRVENIRLPKTNNL